MELFRKIAFESGMPLIIVDLFTYITGQERTITKAMKLLNERVASKRKEKIKKVKYGDGGTSLNPGLNALSFLGNQLANHFQKRVFEKIPPLKEYPDEIESDDTNISDKTDYIVKKTNLNVKIKNFKEDYDEHPAMIETLEKSFIKMSELKPHKDEKDLNED